MNNNVGQGRGETVIRHKTYLFDVVSSATPSAFTSQTIAINPGLIQTEPWVSPIANQYEQWTPGMWEIVFVSTSSNYAANTALGKVIIAAEYNPANVQPTGTYAGQPFTSSQEMENSQWATVCKVDEDMCHALDCSMNDRPTKVLYVRSTTVPSGQDIRFYDLCNVQIASVGCPTASVKLGELWIRNVNVFQKPVMNGGLLGRTIITQQWLSPSNITGPGSLLQTATTAATTNTVGFKFVGVAPTGWIDTFYLWSNGGGICRIYMPSWLVNGTFRFSINLVCASAAVTIPTVTYNGSLSQQTNMSQLTQPFCSPPTGTTSTTLSLTDFFYVNGAPTTSVSNYLEVGAMVCGSGKGYISLDQINDNLVTG